MSQLFRWRKELAGRDWSVCAAVGGGRSATDDDGGASTEERKSQASSRLSLVAGTASGSVARSTSVAPARRAGAILRGLPSLKRCKKPTTLIW